MKKLEKQFEVMERCLDSSAQVSKAFVEMNKLMKLFYSYLEKKSLKLEK